MSSRCLNALLQKWARSLPPSGFVRRNSWNTLFFQIPCSLSSRSTFSISDLCHSSVSSDSCDSSSTLPFGPGFALPLLPLPVDPFESFRPFLLLLLPLSDSWPEVFRFFLPLPLSCDRRSTSLGCTLNRGLSLDLLLDLS